MRYIRDPKKRLAFIHNICKVGIKHSRVLCLGLCSIAVFYPLQSIKVCHADAPEDPADPNTQLDEDGQPIPKPQHGGCGHEQPNIRKEGLKLMLVTSRKTDEDGEEQGGKATKVEDRKNLPASAALMIMKKIPDEDLRIMGLSMAEARPEWMILTVLPVPPPAVRPSVTVDGGAMRSEDDLTYSAALSAFMPCTGCRPADLATLLQSLPTSSKQTKMFEDSSKKERLHTSSTSSRRSFSTTLRHTWTMTCPASLNRCKNPAARSSLSEPA
jgi:hypothetical protein